MVFGRLFRGLAPRKSVRFIATAAIFTIAAHVLFDLDASQTFSAFVGFLAAFFGVSGADSLLVFSASWMLALAAGNPMLLVLAAAAGAFFFVDPLSSRQGTFLDSLGFAIKIVVVTVLAYVSALVIGPPVVDFVMSGGGLGG